MDTEVGSTEGRGSTMGRGSGWELMLHDPLVVRADVVVPYLRDFIEETNRVNGGTTPAGSEKFLSGQALLCERVGIDTKSLSQIVSGRTMWVGEQLVDALFTRGMGRPDLYGDFEFVPNPYWNQERWLRWKVGCESD